MMDELERVGEATGREVPPSRKRRGVDCHLGGRQGRLRRMPAGGAQDFRSAGRSFRGARGGAIRARRLMKCWGQADGRYRQQGDSDRQPGPRSRDPEHPGRRPKRLPTCPSPRRIWKRSRQTRRAQRNGPSGTGVADREDATPRDAQPASALRQGRARPISRGRSSTTPSGPMQSKGFERYRTEVVLSGYRARNHAAWRPAEGEGGARLRFRIAGGEAPAADDMSDEIPF